MKIYDTGLKNQPFTKNWKPRHNYEVGAKKQELQSRVMRPKYFGIEVSLIWRP